jgi:hypothetical protein
LDNKESCPIYGRKRTSIPPLAEYPNEEKNKEHEVQNIKERTKKMKARKSVGVLMMQEPRG